MKPLLLVLLAAVPSAAQWETIEMRFQGVGCVSCVESIPSRIRRVRGVSDVTVNPEAGVVTVKLDRTNRARVEQIRDFIEQDGTKVTGATVAGRGNMTREDGRWTFRIPGQPAVYWLELEAGAAPEPGPARISGAADSVKPAEGAIVIRVSSIERGE